MLTFIVLFTTLSILAFVLARGDRREAKLLDQEIQEKTYRITIKEKMREEVNLQRTRSRAAVVLAILSMLIAAANAVAMVTPVT